MKINISKNLYESLKERHKNIDYSLQCFIDSLDSEACSSVYKTLISINLGEKKETCEISDNTIDTINTLFGRCDNNIVEVLIWISAFLPEI